MDELPTIIDRLQNMPEDYRKAFYAKALALEIEAWTQGHIELWRMYGAITDAYLDAFEVVSDIETLELEDWYTLDGELVQDER